MAFNVEYQYTLVTDFIIFLGQHAHIFTKTIYKSCFFTDEH